MIIPLIDEFKHIDELILKFTNIIQNAPSYKFDSIIQDAINQGVKLGQTLQLSRELDRNEIRNHTMDKLEQRIKDLESNK